MYSFDWPWMFLALPLPILIYWLSKPAKIKPQHALKVPFYDQINNMVQPLSPSRVSFSSPLFLMTFLIWCFVVLASAQPKWSGEAISIPVSGRDLMMAVDISGSMETADMFFAKTAVDRLTAVKSVLMPFIREREGDRLGLILFADHAYLQTPLTFDRKTI